jgi:hypothetical protein
MSTGPTAGSVLVTMSGHVIAARTLHSDEIDAAAGPIPGHRTDWWFFNHVGAGFYGKNFTPLPKGGGSEGWIKGHLRGGLLTWHAVVRMHRLAAAPHTRSNQGRT